MTQTKLPGQPVHPISQPVPYSSAAEIEREVARIAAMDSWGADNGAAHAAAEALVQGTLEAIAGCNAQAIYLAAAVLKVWDLDLAPRYEVQD